MKLPRIPQIQDLSALLEILADHKKHLAHLEELAGLHDLLNKKLQAVENIDAIEGMLSDAKAKLFEAEHLKAEATRKFDEATRASEEILDRAKSEAKRINEKADECLQTANLKQSECDALQSQLEKKLALVAEHETQLNNEIAKFVEQSRTVSALRIELKAKVDKVSEVFA